jgi:hypothetical protein
MTNEHTQLMEELAEVRIKATALAADEKLGYQIAEAVTVLCDIVATLAARIEALDGSASSQ